MKILNVKLCSWQFKYEKINNNIIFLWSNNEENVFKSINLEKDISLNENLYEILFNILKYYN